MEFRDIIGYEGMYQISDTGVVKNIKKSTHSFTLKRVQTYASYRLRKNGNNKTLKAHRLVAQAFIENPLKRKFVNHKDGNKLNNHVSNLEWCSHLENMCHSVKMISDKNTVGASKCKTTGKWKSRIKVKGKEVFLGRFTTKNEAYMARVRYEKEKGIVNKYL